ncbi:MAG: tail fiber assembly protein [Aeromonadaceae bacterium]
MNEPRVVWGDDGFASESGWDFAHCINQSTGELLYSQDVWVSVGTGLPAGAFLDSPPIHEDGKAIVRQNGAWVLVEDLRGTTAYNKQTKQSEVINSLGPLPIEITLIAPTSQFDVWSEESVSWVKDDQAEKEAALVAATEKRSSLLAEANQYISVLSDAVDLGMATEAEVESYNEWRRYRIELTRLNLTIYPVNFPKKPK